MLFYKISTVLYTEFIFYPRNIRLPFAYFIAPFMRFVRLPKRQMKFPLRAAVHLHKMPASSFLVALHLRVAYMDHLMAGVAQSNHSFKALNLVILVVFPLLVSLQPFGFSPAKRAFSAILSVSLAPNKVPRRGL